MQHVIDAADCAVAGVEIADVALDEVEVLPGFGSHNRLDHVQVLLVAGEEVVETDNLLPQLQQVLEEVGADEAGAACDEPVGRVFLHFFAQLFILSHMQSSTCVVLA